jgi:hypothetical protein
MNNSLKKVIWIIFCGILIAATTFALIQSRIQSRRVNQAKQDLADTRKILREQGFKTEFSDFKVTTDAVTRSRMATLTAFKDPMPMLFSSSYEELDVALSASNAAMIVIWKQDKLKTGSGTFHWADLDGVLNTNHAALDAACYAALSGPICFDAVVNGYNIVPPGRVGNLRYFLRALFCRAMFELHAGKVDSAWTNLLAETRLVTALDPGTDGNVHRWRNDMLACVFTATWQALQNDDWSDARLAALQQEWESVDFFKNLPETEAIQCICEVYDCELFCWAPLFQGYSFSQFADDSLHDPAEACSRIKDAIGLMRYRGYEELVDEKNVWLFYQAREPEVQHTIQLPTWAEMCAQPGVTNEVVLKSVRYRLRNSIKTGEQAVASILLATAEDEMRRRILVTAIALERYRDRHGAYPATLAQLVPEFLKVAPVDFADGKPLRYRPTDDGHFVLYSIGLDCVDDGGKMSTPGIPLGSDFPIATNVDIVWPSPTGVWSR